VVAFPRTKTGSPPSRVASESQSRRELDLLSQQAQIMQDESKGPSPTKQHAPHAAPNESAAKQAAQEEPAPALDPRIVINGITIHVGASIFASDALDRWFPAKIVAVDKAGENVRVHWDGFKKSSDFTCAFTSPRIQAMVAAPAFIALRRSDKHGVGAFAAKKLEKGRVLGEYFGKIISVAEAQQQTGNNYLFDVKDGKRVVHVIDGQDAKTSSWLRYMNAADHRTEQNSKFVQKGLRIFLETTRVVPLDEELLTWYGNATEHMMK